MPTSQVLNGLPETLAINRATGGNNPLITTGDFVEFQDTSFNGTLDTATLTASRAWNFPDASGFLSLTTNSSGISDVTLGTVLSNDNATGGNDLQVDAGDSFTFGAAAHTITQGASFLDINATGQLRLGVGANDWVVGGLTFLSPDSGQLIIVDAGGNQGTLEGGAMNTDVTISFPTDDSGIIAILNNSGGENFEDMAFTANKKIIFRDANQFVHSSGAGALLHAALTTQNFGIGGNTELVVNAAGLTIGSGAAGIDYALTFNGETNDGLITWKEDEDHFEFNDEILMAIAEEIQFRATTNRIFSDAVDSLTVHGNVTTKVGKDGDVILGDALTNLVIYPNVDGAFDLGKAGNTFGDLRLSGDIIHTGTNIGFYSSTPVAQSSAYTPTNVTPDRAYDADATTLDEVSDVLGTLIADLQLTGLIG